MSQNKQEPVRKLFELFLDSLGGRQTAVNRRNYRHRLRFFLSQFGDKRADELTTQDINTWHRQMIDLGHADPTNAGYRQALKGFLNWCVREELINRSPADHLKTGSYVPEEVSIPDETDVQRVTELALELLDSNDYATVRKATLWLYQYEVGGRLGGLHYLRLREVEKVLKKGPNQYGSYRAHSREKTGDVVHEFSDVTAAALQLCLDLRPVNSGMRFFVSSKKSKTKSDPVMKVRGLSLSGVQKDFRSICQDAGVSPIFPHSLRDRIGDLYTRVYGPKIAARKLNHGDISTTLNWYHRASKDDVSVATMALRPQTGRSLQDALINGFFKNIGD